LKPDKAKSVVQEEFIKQKDYETRIDWMEPDEESKKVLHTALQQLLEFTDYLQTAELKNIYNNLLYNPSNISYKIFEDFINNTFVTGSIYTPTISYYIHKDGQLILNVVFIKYVEEKHISSTNQTRTSEIELIIELLDNKLAFTELGHKLSLPEYDLRPSEPAPASDYTEHSFTAPLHISNLTELNMYFPSEASIMLDENVVNLILNDLPSLSLIDNTKKYYTENRASLLNKYAVEDFNNFSLLCTNYKYQKNDISKISIIPESIKNLIGTFGLTLIIEFIDGTSTNIGVQILDNERMSLRLYPL
jgi:hypothetical protein